MFRLRAVRFGVGIPIEKSISSLLQNVQTASQPPIQSATGVLSFHSAKVRVPHCLGFKIILGHTYTYSVGLLWNESQPDEETSTWQHTTIIKDIPALGGIRTRNPIERTAADLRLRPLGHRDRYRGYLPGVERPGARI